MYQPKLHYKKWSELQIQYILGWIILRQFKLLVLNLLYKQCLLFLKDFLYAICKTLKNPTNLFSVETRILQNSQLTLCEVASMPLVINAAYTYNLHLTPHERDWYFRGRHQKCWSAKIMYHHQLKQSEILNLSTIQPTTLNTYITSDKARTLYHFLRMACIYQTLLHVNIRGYQFPWGESFYVQKLFLLRSAITYNKMVIAEFNM